MKDYAGSPSPPKVLMLSYTFPPFFSVGGSIRVVKFIRYLTELGWIPVVLTIDDRKEYDTQRKQGSEDLLTDVPAWVHVYRTNAGEPTLELLEKGRSARRKSRVAAVGVNFLRAVRQWVTRFLLLPDEHITWLPFALRQGRKIARDEGIDVIFATCPPHSVALIGACLKWLTGKPLVLDFRDDWINTPSFRARPWIRRQIERWLEARTVRMADRIVLVTRWSLNAFLERYPGLPQERFVFIPNGCDLKDFEVSIPESASTRPFTIVHAGLLADSDGWKRSPWAFFEALKSIRDHDAAIGASLQVVFTGFLPESYRQMIDSLGLSTTIREAGPLSREDLVATLKRADLLLAINYDGFETLIPGKIYDYWAAGHAPILLLSCDGAAQSLVEQKNLGVTVGPYDSAAIEQAIVEYYRRRESGKPVTITTAGIEEYDRRNLTQRLAQTLSSLQPNGDVASSSTGIDFTADHIKLR